ncbi:MAG TPA: helix-turn-helix domain-containing protein [Acidimicrobiales bacterium]
MPSASRVPSRARWAGVPAEDRRAERRALLIAAAYELLGTEGWSGTTVRAVCQRARLNPRYFYESFPGLDDLVVAVYDQVVAELADEVLAARAAAPDDDQRAQVHAVVERIVRFVDEDRRRARVLYVEALGNEALNRRRIETGHSLAELVERDAAGRRGAGRGDGAPADRIGRIGAAILVGGFSELLVAWLAGRIDVGREQLVDDATVLFLALGEAAAGVAAGRTGRSGRPPQGPGERRGEPT